jgi:hypothetical protein
LVGSFGSHRYIVGYFLIMHKLKIHTLHNVENFAILRYRF